MSLHNDKNVLPVKINISDIKFEKCENFSFLRPRLVNLKKNGKPISWELIEPREYVSVLIYNTDINSFILVKQFRPAVFLSKNKHLLENRNLEIENSFDGQCGITFELCSGFKEENETNLATAIREVYEETGYDISKKIDIEHVFTFNSSTDCEGKIGHIYFVQVCLADLTGMGGGLQEENEETDNFSLPRNEISSFIFDVSKNKDSDCIAALLWFSKYKINSYSLKI